MCRWIVVSRTDKGNLRRKRTRVHPEILMLVNEMEVRKHMHSAIKHTHTYVYTTSTRTDVMNSQRITLTIRTKGLTLKVNLKPWLYFRMAAFTDGAHTSVEHKVILHFNIRSIDRGRS